MREIAAPSGRLRAGLGDLGGLRRGPGAERLGVRRPSEEAYRPDAGPSVVGEGSVDGAALRKRHVERLRSDTSPVTVLRGESALELGQDICEAVMPRRPKDTPILLKPNLCGIDGIVDPAKSKGDDGMNLAWSPTRTPKPNFHVPESFGALVLDPAPR